MIDLPDDAQRYPGLTPAGEQMLRFLREHPHAPIYRNASGHRLLPEELPQVQAFAEAVRDASVDPRADLGLSWLRDYVAAAMRQVPHYRRYGSAPEQFTDLPTICRGDLARSSRPRPLHRRAQTGGHHRRSARSEEHTSELQSPS